MAEPSIQVVLVDDHAIVRKGLAMVLRLEPGIDVLGEAGDIQTAEALVTRVSPDVILLDRIIPGSEPEDNIRRLRRAAPDSRIIMLTGTEVDDRMVDIVKAGLDGYILKEIQPDEMMHAIRTVAAGDAYLQPSVTRHLIDRLIVMDSSPQNLLTPRELEILEWMASPATYREIARQLSISDETVRSHAKHILSKLGQSNRAGAVKEAEKLGLLRAR
jgi:DNA-binding NarL/FixJ family response regulator